MSIIKNARVAFIADDKQYRAGLKRVEQDTKRTTDKLNQLGQTATRVMLASAGAQAGLVKLYRDQEQAEIGVAAAIRQTGKEREISVDYIKAYSSELQQSSIFGDEAAIAASTLGLRLGNLNKEQLPRFVRLAADVSTVMGKALPQTARRLATYLSDPQQGMARLAQAGITLDQQTKDYIRTLVEAGDILKAQGVLMNELEARFAGASQAALQGTGIIIAAKNAWGDLGEKVGEVIFKSLKPVFEWLKSLAEKLQKNEQAIKAVANALKFLTIFGVVTKLATLFGVAIAKLSLLLIAFRANVTAAKVALAGLWAGATLGLSYLIAFAPEMLVAFGEKIPAAFNRMQQTAIIAFSKMKLFFFESLEGIIEKLNKWGLASDETLRGISESIAGAEGNIARARDSREHGKSAGERENESRMKLLREYYQQRKQAADEAAKAEAEADEKRRKDKIAANEAAREAELKRQKEKEAERAEFEREQEIAKTEAKNEALRMRLQGLEETDIEFYAREQEIKLARREAERIEDEEQRELELENLRLQQEALAQAKAEHAAKLKEKEAKEQKAAEKKQKAQYASTQKQLLGHLQTLFGEYTAAGKAFFVAQKALEIAELIQATEANAAQAFTNAMATFPPPGNVAIAKKMYALTKVTGYLGVAAAAATAVQGLTGKMEGGLIHGNPARGDAYPYLLQAGEAVVPRSNYDDLVRGVRARMASEDDDGYAQSAEPAEVNVSIELSGDAGNLLRAHIEGNEALGV